MTTDWDLLEMRGRLQKVDTQLIALLGKRFEIMREVRAWKRSRGLPLQDPKREQEVLAHCRELGSSLDVPEQVVSLLYAEFFAAVRGSPDARGIARLTKIKAGDPDIEENAIQAPGDR